MEKIWSKPKYIKLSSNSDERGSFVPLFKTRGFQQLSDAELRQLNISKNVKAGTLRGMHSQNHNMPDAKLVYCLGGKLFDCVIDIRSGSPTFLQKYVFTLHSDDNSVLYIPSGFAHGYQTLADNTSILYGHFGHYDPKNEHGLNPLDPKLDINWPREISEVSQRDLAFRYICDQYKGISDEM